MPLTADQTRRLEEIKNLYTRYEVVLARQTGEKVLVGYTGRKSRKGLLNALRRHPDAVIELVGGENVATFTKEGLSFSSGWTAKFSGRTERDAILQGEIEHIKNYEITNTENKPKF